MVTLSSKPDFAQTLARFEAWWEQRLVDRPPVSLHVRPPRPLDLPRKEHGSLRSRWFDFEHVIDCVEATVAQSIYPTDLFPACTPNLGPEICATVFGSDLEFSDRTSWSRPVVRRIRDVQELQPRLDTPCWQAIRAATDLSLARGAGRWITGVTDLHTNGDLLASLRDPQELAMDLADDLEGVGAACAHLAGAFALLYDDLYGRVAAAGQPFTTWTPLLHAGPAMVAQCDFICMISPGMFRATVLPCLEREIAHVQRSIYHLDGPGALRHLDDLLALPRLNAVQWVFGVGNGPAARWTDVYRRIQAAGKSVQVIADDLDDARTVAQALDPRGAWLTPGGWYTRTEAEDFLAWVEKWARG